MSSYQFTAQLTDVVLDGLRLIPDFECEVEVSCELDGGDLEVHCTDVLVDGVSLRGGSALAKMIRLEVMMQADDELENAGDLWDRVRDRNNLTFAGRDTSDGYWAVAAE